MHWDNTVSKKSSIFLPTATDAYLLEKRTWFPIAPASYQSAMGAGAQAAPLTPRRLPSPLFSELRFLRAGALPTCPLPYAQWESSSDFKCRAFPIRSALLRILLLTRISEETKLRLGLKSPSCDWLLLWERQAPESLCDSDSNSWKALAPSNLSGTVLSNDTDHVCHPHNDTLKEAYDYPNDCFTFYSWSQLVQGQVHREGQQWNPTYPGECCWRLCYSGRADLSCLFGC